VKSLAFTHEDETSPYSFSSTLFWRGMMFTAPESESMVSGNYENKNLAHNAHSVGESEYHLEG